MNHSKKNSNAILWVEEAVKLLGFEWLDVWREQGAKEIVVFIDRPGGTVNADDCAVVSSKILDSPIVDELVPDGYQLVVSSPGLNRPLRKSVHFQSAVGENIAVWLGQWPEIIRETN